MGRGLVLGAAASAAALVVGFFLGMTFGAPEQTPTGRGAELTSAGSGATSATADAGESSRRADRGDRTETKPRAAEPSRAAVAAAATDGFDVAIPTGGGEIRGSCRSADGEPVADVEVTLAMAPPQAWRDEAAAPSEKVPLEERVRRFVREQLWAERARTTVTTGADGLFAFGSLADAEFEVTAKSPTHSFRRGAGGRVKPGAKVEFVAGTEVALLLDVRMPDGKAPATATVSLRAANMSRGASWSPEQPRIWAAPGAWKLSVHGGPNQSLVAEMGEVVLGPDSGKAPLLVELKGRRGILARAVRPEEWKAAACNWHTAPLDGSPEPTDAEIVAAGSGHFRAVRSAHMLGGAEPAGDSQTWWDLAPGRHLVACWLDGGPVARRSVEVRDGLAEVEVEVAPPDPSRIVQVTVAASDGTPAKNVTFTWERTTAEWSERYQPSRALARGPGAWTVVRALPGQRTASSGGSRRPKADEGQWWLCVAGDRQGAARVEVRGAGSVSVQLEAPCTLVVTVTGLPDGRSWSLMPYRVLSAGSLTGQGSHTQFKSGETPRIGPLEPGNWELQLLPPAKDRSMYLGPVATARVTIPGGGGDVAVTMTVPPLHTVRIEGGADLAGNHIMLQRNSRESGASPSTMSAELDTDGRATFPDVPEGEYTVHLGTGKPFTVRIPETTVIRPQ